MRARNYIGTSGWSYEHWKDVFFPADLKATQWLEYYAQRLDSVELNNTFYNLPRPSSVEKWAGVTPKDFSFAVKGSRFITHRKKLSDPEEATERFFEAIEGLGGKTGPILWQLPPGWEKDAAKLDDFLRTLPSRYRYTVELRNRSWLDESVYSVLRKHNAAFCIYQLGGFESPEIVTADFVYIRLHGPEKSKYTGKYGDSALESWKRKIEEWNRGGKDVYCYFDNDQKGYAVFNAIQLREMLTGEQVAASGSLLD